ncbi:MAG: PH domain-containing protein [Actinobacteria bacterium]|nr:MAG: PH domain-containing protein [Actinomycetota bacterium]
MLSVEGVTTLERPLPSSGRRRPDRTSSSAVTHWVLLAPAAAGILLSLLFLVALLVEAPGWYVLALMPLAVCLAAFVRQLPAYRRFSLTITPSHLLVSTGKATAALPIELARVKGLSLRQTTAGKILGYGDIAVRHAHGYWVFRNISGATVFRKRLRDAVVRAKEAKPEEPPRPSQVVG